MLKVNGPLALIVRALPPLFRSTRPVPVSPITVPPTVKLLVVQEMPMVVTFALATVPEPFATVHVWLGPVGCVRTVAADAAPLARCVVKLKPAARGATARCRPP